MSGGLICPNCGTEVPNERLLGIEEPSIYDGILIWRDERCGHQWPRFSGSDWRRGAAERLLALAAPMSFHRGAES